jgi:hypothetical protein
MIMEGEWESYTGFEKEGKNNRERGVCERERVSEKYGNVLYHSICMHSIETECDYITTFPFLMF